MSAPGYDQPVPSRRRPDQIADYKAWAQFTRALLGWADLTRDSDPVVVTEFREWAGLPRRTESQLRQHAADQARMAAQ
ncbi:MAG: hypothetical protein ACLP52_11225 [Streptosporangiaceae bacterium]